MNRPTLPPFLNLWVILGALAFAGCLLVTTLIGIGWTSPRPAPDVGFVPADLTMIPAPTHTPQVQPTGTLDPNMTATLPAGQIGVGGYVQITGTEGEGLRLRAAPGLAAQDLSLGFDEEVFQVRDGPQQVDGYTWWYLVAPYDETRAGWAAADFLAVVPSP
ncbi:MAG TPA: hypothetical protein VGJ22_14020 [Anaerolineales bacterium]|jgi:hypothetical protein